MHNAVMQYCSEKITDDRRNAIYGYSFQTGMAGNILLTVVILAMAWWKKLAGQDTVAFYLTAMCGLPFLTYLDHYLQIILRVRLENTQYARTNMVYVVVHVGGNIVMTLIWGVPGLIASMYVAHGAAAVRSAVVLGKQGLFREIRNTPERLTRSNRREYLNYALVYALDNAGKGLAVIIMVIQVAGSGGTYPIDVLPEIFRKLYVCMPFRYGMDMIRETIGGLYGNYYAKNMIVLLGMCVCFTVFGLLAWYPARRLNQAIARSMEESGLM
jgi:uncharacterized phage infection (PIP) family protein YhgE